MGYGRPKGQRHARGTGVVTEAQHAAAKRNLMPGGWNKGRRKSEAEKALKRDILQRIQDVDILEFARIAGVSFEKRPGQELALRLLYGLPLPEGRVKTFLRRKCEGFVLEEVEISWLEYYRLLTGNDRVFEPNEAKSEAYLCIGARGGKTKITSVITGYEATRNRWLSYLGPKEKGYAGIIATNLDQARDLIQQSTFDLFNESELKPLIAGCARRQIVLTNGLSIRSFPCNVRAPRGFPYFFTAYDEAGWYYLEGAKADTKIHAAINPRRLQFPGSKHVEITTPAGKQGRFYTVHSQGGQVHRRLTMQAPTWLFRPEIEWINPGFIKTQYEEDPDEADREYGAEFDETVDVFLAEQDVLDAMVLPSEAPYEPTICYVAGVDASGLSGNDRFGFAIVGKNLDNGHHVCAVDRSYPDRDPDPIMADVGELCSRYRIRQVYTDRYAKGWVHAALRKLGLEPLLAPGDMEVWLNAKQLMIGHKLELPVDDELKDGLKTTYCAHGSKGQTGQTSQRPRIVRPRSKKGHGDKAEAVAKAVWGSSQNTYRGTYQTQEERAAEAEQARQEAEYDPINYGRE